MAIPEWMKCSRCRNLWKLRKHGKLCPGCGSLGKPHK